MRPFSYQRATDPASAMQALAAAAAANDPLTEASIQPLAGGTTLIDLMKLDVMRPTMLVDINPLAKAWSAIHFEDGNLKLGALARMSRYTEKTAKGWTIVNGRILVVTHGLGESGVPLRFGAPPQIMILTLHPGPAAKVEKVSESPIH